VELAVSGRFREEVLSVKLAELRSKHQVPSVPESIVAVRERRRLPDVIIGEYWGVRVVLEGRVKDQYAAKDYPKKNRVR